MGVDAGRDEARVPPVRGKGKSRRTADPSPKGKAVRDDSEKRKDARARAGEQQIPHRTARRFGMTAKKGKDARESKRKQTADPSPKGKAVRDDSLAGEQQIPHRKAKRFGMTAKKGKDARESKSKRRRTADPSPKGKAVSLGCARDQRDDSLGGSRPFKNEPVVLLTRALRLARVSWGKSQMMREGKPESSECQSGNAFARQAWTARLAPDASGIPWPPAVRRLIVTAAANRPVHNRSEEDRHTRQVQWLQRIELGRLAQIALFRAKFLIDSWAIRNGYKCRYLTPSNRQSHRGLAIMFFSRFGADASEPGQHRRSHLTGHQSLGTIHCFFYSQHPEYRIPAKAMKTRHLTFSNRNTFAFFCVPGGLAGCISSFACAACSFQTLHHCLSVFICGSRRAGALEPQTANIEALPFDILRVLSRGKMRARVKCGRGRIRPWA